MPPLLSKPQRIIIVGLTGTGKTTLFNVLAKLKPGTTGAGVESSSMVAETKGHVIYKFKLDCGDEIIAVDTNGLGLVVSL